MGETIGFWGEDVPANNINETSDVICSTLEAIVSVTAPTFEIADGGPTIASGNARPTTTPPNGSLFLRTTGKSGESTLYMYIGNEWTRGMVEGSLIGDADTVLSVANGNYYKIPAGTSTGNHNLTLSTAGAVRGHIFVVERLDASGFTWSVINGGPAGTTIHTMLPNVRIKATYWFDGANYQLSSFFPLATT